GHGIHRSVLARCRAWYPRAEGGAMRLAVYGAVLAIALGSVLLGLDWQSAPMSPMVDTKAGLNAAAPPAPVVPTASVSVPTTPPAPEIPPNRARPTTPPTPPPPKANIGAPIPPPNLTPTPTPPPNPPASAAAAQATADAPVVAPESQAHCNVDACFAAYRSFNAADCTYQPTSGPRRLCRK